LLAGAEADLQATRDVDTDLVCFQWQSPDRICSGWKDARDDDHNMVIVIRCDVCKCALARDAVTLSFTRTLRRVDQEGQVRVIDSGDADAVLLCSRCARYLERCALSRVPSDGFERADSAEVLS